YAESGEGIRPAIESGLMAARAIVDACGEYSRDRLERYVAEIDRRFGLRRSSRAWPTLVPTSLSAALGPRLLPVPSLVRHVLLDRWFLPRQAAPLPPF